jgi:hypothetical protein
MCIETAVESFFGDIDRMVTILQVQLSMTMRCASLVITNTSPFPRFSGVSDSETSVLFIKLLESESVFTVREIIGEHDSDRQSVRNRNDNVLVSSTATCNMNGKCEFLNLLC